jgi:hypothetical protein
MHLDNTLSYGVQSIAPTIDRYNNRMYRGCCSWTLAHIRIVLCLLNNIYPWLSSSCTFCWRQVSHWWSSCIKCVKLYCMWNERLNIAPMLPSHHKPLSTQESSWELAWYTTVTCGTFCFHIVWLHLYFS